MLVDHRALRWIGHTSQAEMSQTIVDGRSS